jgi:prefoldin subunit 5
MGLINELNQNQSADQGSKGYQGQIQGLKRKVSALTQENESLRSKIPPRVNVNLQGNRMTLTESILQNGKNYSSSKSIEFGQAFAAIRPLVEPLIHIARGASLGNDVVTRRQKAHRVDEQGKPTKELLTDENGAQVWLPNHRDKANAISLILMQDPECRKALLTIGNKLANSQQEIKDVSKRLAQLPPNSIEEEKDEDFDFSL